MPIRATTSVSAGAGQAFDISGMTNDYLRMLEYKKQRDERENQLAGQMLEDYGLNKNKVRAQDASEYTQMYNQLQDLYISNKGLYTNPLKHPEAYKKAQYLKNEMLKYAANSRNMTELTGTWADLKKSGKEDELEDGLGDHMQFINSKSLADIKAHYGQLPTVDLIKYKPKMPDMLNFSQDLHGLADGMDGGYDDVRQPLVDNAKNPNVPLGSVETSTRRVYKPEALLASYEMLAASPKYRNIEKVYAASFKDALPEDIEKMQQEVDAKLGNQSFQIKDAKTYALADAMSQYGSRKLETKLVKDEKYAEEQDKQKQQAALNKSITLANVQDRQATNRMLKKEELVQSRGAKQDAGLKENVGSIIKGLRNKDTSTEDIQQWSSGIVGMLGGNLDGETVQVIDPKENNSGSYAKTLMDWDKNSYSKAYTSGAGGKGENAESMYKRGMKVMAIPIMQKDKDGNPMGRKYIIISPNMAHSEEKVFSLLRNLGASEKKGFDQFDRIDE